MNNRSARLPDAEVTENQARQKQKRQQMLAFLWRS
jgi:hypothetical protein